MSNFYAQLNESDVCTSITQTSGVILHDNCILIESYDVSKVGYIYDRDNNTWLGQAPAESIRLISTRAFMSRLAQSERIALRASADDIVIDMMEDLRMATYVDLDDAGLAAGL